METFDDAMLRALLVDAFRPYQCASLIQGSDGRVSFVIQDGAIDIVRVSCPHQVIRSPRRARSLIAQTRRQLRGQGYALLPRAAFRS